MLRDVMLHLIRSKAPLPGDKPLDQLMLAATLHYMREPSPEGAVRSNVSRAAWLLDTLVEGGDATGVWTKLHDDVFFTHLVAVFASAHGNDSTQLGTLIAKLLASKTAWQAPPPVESLRPLYAFVHTRFGKEKAKNRKVPCAVSESEASLHALDPLSRPFRLLLFRL